MNFIIDGNALLNTITSVLIYSANKDYGDIYELDIDDNKVVASNIKVQFDSFVKTFTKNIIYPFKNHIDKLWFVFDMPNWRKMYVKWYFNKEDNKDKQAFGYKDKQYNDKQRDHRKQVNDLMKLFHEQILHQFTELPGIEVMQAGGAEGDDIIMYLCNILKDEDIVIWTVDTDLTQLIERGKRSVFVITPKQQKSKKKIYVTEEFYKPSTEQQNLLLFEFDKFDPRDIIDYLHDTKEYQINQIDPAREIILKIISGDKKSDNIPSIYTWSNNGRNMSLTAKKAGEIVDEIMAEYSWKEKDILKKLDGRDSQLIDLIVEKVFDKYSAIDKKDDTMRNNIRDSLLLNIKLIRLTMENLPQPIVDRITTQFDYINLKEKFDQKLYLEKMDV